MSGHSKWANIKHRKAAQDSKKGKVFTKLGKELTIAAKAGGGDLESNFRLRTIVDKARAVNMPLENIQRAIKKGTGEIPGVVYEALNYEGYGPYGVAVIVECLTDNKNRTVAEVRRAFSSKGGTLAETGAVGWMFAKKGVIRIKGHNLSEDKLLERLLEFDVDDINVHDELATITLDLKKLDIVRKVLANDSYTIESSEIEWVPSTTTSLPEDQSHKVIEFLEALEELEDVQDVYSNLA